MLLWILTVAVPTFIIVKSFAVGIQNDTLKELLGKSMDLKIILVSSFLIISPLTFAVCLQKLSKKQITKHDLKENFYIQIYTFVPLQSTSIFAFFSIVNNVDTIDTIYATSLSVLYSIVGMIGALYWYWFLYCEFYIIKETLNIRGRSSIVLFLLISILAYLLTMLILLLLLSLMIPDITKFI
jgi:hypothetical protein